MCLDVFVCLFVCFVVLFALFIYFIYLGYLLHLIFFCGLLLLQRDAFKAAATLREERGMKQKLLLFLFKYTSIIYFNLLFSLFITDPQAAAAAAAAAAATRHKSLQQEQQQH